MKIRYILILLMFSMALGVSAQDDTTDEKPRKAKKENPKKELKELRKQFEELEAKHAELLEDYKRLQTKDSTLLADMQAQEEARQQQESYHELCRKNLYQEYFDYLDAPFTVISLDKVISIGEFAKQYAVIDADAPTLLTRTEACMKHKQGYDQMEVMLRQPLNAKKIQAIRDSLDVIIELGNANKLTELAMSKVQWHEIDSIDLFFARYQPGVIWLQNVIKKCEEQYRNDGLNTNNIADVGISKNLRQNIINAADRRQTEGISRRISAQGNIADYILLIPWLRERYEIFISEPNPLKPTEKTRKAMKEVLDINTRL